MIEATSVGIGVQAFGSSRNRHINRNFANYTSNSGSFDAFGLFNTCSFLLKAYVGRCSFHVLFF